MELTIKDSTIKTVINRYLEDQIYDFYAKEVVEAAGLPPRKALIEQILANPKFQKAFTKYLLEYLDQDLMSDAVAETINDVTDVFVKVEQAYERQNELDLERKQKEQEQDAIKLLKARGYKVTQ